MYPYVRASTRPVRIDDERLSLSPALAQLAAELEERSLPETDEAPKLADGGSKTKRAEREEALTH